MVSEHKHKKGATPDDIRISALQVLGLLFLKINKHSVVDRNLLIDAREELLKVLEKL